MLYMLPALLRVAAAIYLTATIGLGLRRAQRQLPPAYCTRARTRTRAKHVGIFAALAVLSLLTAVSSGLYYLVLSYRAWADDHGVDVPNGLLPNLFAFVPFKTCTCATQPPQIRLHLARWLADTHVYADAVEILAENARFWWWGQQAELGILAWTVLLATEGRRRRIPVPSLMGYLLLAQLVSLTFAQNLFYIAMLVTPVPTLLEGEEEEEEEEEVPAVSRFSLLDSTLPPKPATWSPKPDVLLNCLLANYALVFLLPYLSGTPVFPPLTLCLRILTFTPLVLPTLLPSDWGTTLPHSAGTKDAYNEMFQLVCFINIMFYAKASVAALMFDFRDTYRHRHGRRLLFYKREHRLWEERTTAVHKVLGSLADHPAVAAVGIDVLLSTLSLGLWVSISRVDLPTLLRAVSDTSGAVGGTMVRLRLEGRNDTAADVAGGDRDTGESESPEPYEYQPNQQHTESSSMAVGLRRKNQIATPKTNTSQKNTGAATTAALAKVAVNTNANANANANGMPWETATIAWTFMVVGGLGVSSAAVFGAEYFSH